MNAQHILNRRNVLVTGGVGYIGSHTSRQLVNAGCNVVVVDNFYSGNRWAVPPQAHLVEGDAGDDPIVETTRLAPINPYGRSKLMTEWMLEDAASSSAASSPEDAFRYVALRYFNVAGANLDGALDEATPEATHLIHVACQAACGKKEKVAIYSTDYPTPDGTCVRDYIHVEDLATAQLLALSYLPNLENFCTTAFLWEKNHPSEPQTTQ